MLSLYEQAAAKKGCSLCFFRLSDLSAEKKYVTCYVKEQNKYRLRKLPVPQVIYKRIGHSRDHLPMLQALMDKGITIFNFYEENEKYNIFKLVNRDKELARHQPHTKMATEKNILGMLSFHKRIIIKPNRGEVGKGIMKVEQTGQNKWCLFYKEEQQWKKIFFQEKLPEKLLAAIQQPYIVQEMIDLGTYENKRFDLRVSVQKNENRKWQVSAIFVKVAKEGHFLTNMGQGATACTLRQILKEHPSLSYEKVKKDVQSFALKLAKHLAAYKTKMADFGFDIAITKQGIPYLIEANHISDYPTFAIKNGRLLYTDWNRAFTTPIDYAHAIMKK